MRERKFLNIFSGVQEGASCIFTFHSSSAKKSIEGPIRTTEKVQIYKIFTKLSYPAILSLVVLVSN